jgi:hypothetical protein
MFGAKENPTKHLEINIPHKIADQLPVGTVT